MHAEFVASLYYTSVQSAVLVKFLIFTDVIARTSSEDVTWFARGQVA